MNQWSTLEGWALGLILVHALFRLNVVAFLATCTLQRELNLTHRR